MANMKRSLGMMMAMAAMGMGTYPGSMRPERTPLKKRTDPILPKGCQTYYFDIEGNYQTTFFHRYSFSCIAISEKSAKRKFNKWRSDQRHKIDKQIQEIDYD